MKAWVNAEHRFADALHLTRMEHTKGNWGEDCPDALGGLEYSGPPLLLESKSRKDGFPVLIEKAMAQAHKYPQAKGRVCLVGLHKNGGRSDDDWLVVLRLADFAEIAGRVWSEKGVTI